MTYLNTLSNTTNQIESDEMQGPAEFNDALKKVL